MATGTIRLTKKQILALCSFASQDRIDLTQVWFQGDYACATNGHMLTLVGPTNQLRSFRVDSEQGFGVTSKSLAKYARSQITSTSTLEFSQQGVAVEHKFPRESVKDPEEIHRAPPDFKFPPVHMVIPWAQLEGGSASLGSPVVNAEYFMCAGKAAIIAGYTNENIPYLRVAVGRTDLDAIMVISDCSATGLQCLTLAMPCRV
jgi:hypothetical protein